MADDSADEASGGGKEEGTPATKTATKTASEVASSVDSAGTLGVAATRLREQAKWIVVTVGGLAGVVFAGTGITVLTDLPADPSTSRVAALLVGGAFALVGTAVALVLVAGLASASTVAVGELAGEEALASDPALARWNGAEGGPIAGLLEDYGDARSAYLDALRAWEEDPSLVADTTMLERTARVQDAHEQVVGRLLAAASYLRLRRAFEDAVPGIAVALLFAFAGAGFFVWGASEPDPPPDPTALDALAAPQGAWVVPEERIAEVGAVVGEACVLADEGERPRLEVLVVGPLPPSTDDEASGEDDEDDEPTVRIVTRPDERCAAATFEALPADLRTLAAVPADPPSEEPASTTTTELVDEG